MFETVDFTKIFPLGIPQSALLALDTLEMGKSNADFARLLAKSPHIQARLSEYGWDNKHARMDEGFLRGFLDMPMDLVRKDLTKEEIFLVYHHMHLYGHLTKEMENTPEFALAMKLYHSDWRWALGSGLDGFTWGHHQSYTRAFRNLAFPDFEIGFDITLPSRENGPGKCTNTWLDGAMAIILSQKGKHVLTISVSPTRRGLLINQIQLKEKKGNRWLYKLSCPLFEWVVQCLHIAFAPEGVNLYLIEGKSAADYVRQSYPKEKQDSWDKEEYVMGLYNQKFAQFERKKTWRTNNCIFAKIEAISASFTESVA